MTQMGAGAVRYRVEHRTTYTYGSTVSDAYSVTNLLPRPTPLQEVHDARVVTDPEVDEYDARQDVFGNRVVQLGLHGAHDRFEVVGRSEVTVARPFVPADPSPWEEAVAANAAARGAELFEVGPYLAITPAVQAGGATSALHDLFAPEFTPGRPLLEVAAGVCAQLHHSFVFDTTATDVSTPLDVVVAAGRGVCQDFAHLAISVFRARGLACRYVSGYIETDPPPGEPKSIGADASHAWCAVWIPGFGWLDMDPTNDQFPAMRHVTVAWGRDYRDVAPVRGVVIGPATAQDLDVAVDVQRI